MGVGRLSVIDLFQLVYVSFVSNHLWFHMGKRSFSIVIPNYNGAHLLEEYLPSVLDAAISSSDSYETIVVDDGSTDGSVNLLRSKFPEVRILVNERNLGFGEAINRGVNACQHRHVVLLNNDVWVEKGFFEPLLRHFSQEQVFAVVAKGFVEQDGMVKNESITRLEFREGFLHLIQPGLLNLKEKFEEVCTVAHACGGYSAFDKEKFLALGGFDSLYYPFYWEDVDICYRAWKRGWWVLYEPRSIAHHKCHATIDKIQKRDCVERLHIRNQLLFTWKNVTDKRMLMEHARASIFHIVKGPRRFRWAFLEAFKKIGAVLQRRRISHKGGKYSDHEVVALSAGRPVDWTLSGKYIIR